MAGETARLAKQTWETETGRSGQPGLYIEFQASLVYITSSGSAKASKSNNQQQTQREAPHVTEAA